MKAWPKESVAALDAANICLWEWHIHTDQLIVSNKLALLNFPLNKTTFSSTEWFPCIHKDDINNLLHITKACLLGKSKDYSAEARIYGSDGSLIWVKCTGAVTERNSAGKPLRMSGVLQDITSQKHTETLLQQKASQMDIVAALSEQAYWEWSKVDELLIFSDHFEREYGYKKKKTLRGFLCLIHEKDRRHASETIKNCIAGKQSSFKIEMRMRKRDGSYIWVQILGGATLVEDGVPIRFAGSLINIHALKTTEETLQATLKALEAVFPSEAVAFDEDDDHSIQRKTAKANWLSSDFI